MVLDFARDEGGATAVEYALLASLIAMAMLAAVISVGEGTYELYERIAKQVTEAMS